MFNMLKGSSAKLIENVIELVYFMRGSIQYDDMMYRTPGERDLISDFIERRLKVESKREHPNY